MTILTNSFHNTSYRFLGSADALDWLRMVASGNAYNGGGDGARVRRIQKRLCGVKGCQCAQTSLNERK